MLNIAAINVILKAAVPGVGFFRAGQTPESVELPYIVFTPIIEQRYKDFQVLKQLTGTSPNVQYNYKSPSFADYQYDYVYDSKNIAASRAGAGQFYNLFLTYGLKNKLSLQN